MPHAFLLHLTPTRGTPTPKDLSLYAHGLFYHLLETLDPDLSARVHAAKRVPFTLFARQQKEGVLLRVTTLDDALFAPLLRVVLQESISGLSLGQDSYQVARVLATPEGHPDASYTPWEALLCAEPTRQLELRFLTPTVFSTSRSDGKRHYTPLPIPRLILKSLLNTFQTFSPRPYKGTHVVALETLFDEQLQVRHFDLRTVRHMAGKTPLTGFRGSVTLHYPEHTEQVMCALGQFAALAFYSGVGAKTPYGMGQVRVGSSTQAGKRSKTW